MDLKSKYLYAFQLLGVAFIYFFTAKLGLSLEAVSGFATLVWPPTGIALAAVLLFGYRLWPGIALAAFAANIVTGAPLFAAIAIAIGNTLEALVGAYMLRTFGFDNEFKRARDTYLYVLVGALLVTMIAATIGTTALWLQDVVGDEAYRATWMAWWTGDMMGALIVGYFLLNLRKSATLRGPLLAEAAVLILFFVAANLMLFFDLTAINTVAGENNSLSIIILVLLFYAGIRFGSIGAAWTLFLMFVIGILGTVAGTGPYKEMTLIAGLEQLQSGVGWVGAMILVLAGIADERTVSRSEAEQQKAREVALLESIGDGVVGVDDHERIIYANHAAEEMLAMKTEEMIGKNFFDIVPAQEESGQYVPREERLATRGMALQKSLTKRAHYYVRKDKTRFPASVTVSPVILDGKVLGLVNTFRDVSRETELDHAKDELISLASHQLRTPPTGIMWFAGMLLGEEVGKINDTQRKYLEEILYNNQRMIDVVNAMLNTSRLELGTFIPEPKPFNVTKMIEDVLTELSSQIAQRNLKIEKHYSSVPEIIFDPVLVRMVIQNLLVNAVQYTPNNGVVTVTTDISENEFEFRVRDTGMGIPKDAQSKMFTKMFRAGNTRKFDSSGSGLGLYIVNRILEKFGGTVNFESEENKGTEFTVRIPMKGGPAS